MATNWYDPNSSSAGFYNSPQDFLFKGNDSTWYGQGPAGQEEAGAMPTMGDYYFGGGASSAPAQPQMSPINFGGPSRPEGYNAGPQTRVGGGGSINLGNAVSVPQGPLWQRYQAVQANPAMIEADPAYRYMLEQGEEALRRSAGAKRQRFSGGTMLDFQRHAQGQAANYLKGLLPELRAGAGQEYGMMANEAQAGQRQRSEQSLMSDPYGHARNLAGRFRSMGELQSSPEYAQAARAGRGDAIVQQFLLGQRLMGG
jgi:hypothetical protein